MAYSCSYNSVKKKVIGYALGGILADVGKRFPNLPPRFSIRYDTDLGEYLDFDDDSMPPNGAALKIEVWPGAGAADPVRYVTKLHCVMHGLKLTDGLISLISTSMGENDYGATTNGALLTLLVARR